MNFYLFWSWSPMLFVTSIHRWCFCVRKKKVHRERKRFEKNSISKMKLFMLCCFHIFIQKNEKYLWSDDVAIFDSRRKSLSIRSLLCLLSMSLSVLRHVILFEHINCLLSAQWLMLWFKNLDTYRIFSLMQRIPNIHFMMLIFNINKNGIWAKKKNKKKRRPEMRNWRNY